MERTIKLTIEKAKEWYNSGNEALKEAALQAFRERELRLDFKNIQCFCDVVARLSPIEVGRLNIVSCRLDDHQKALLKLDAIRKVLNRGYNMKATEGKIYYPFIPLVTLDSTYYDDRIRGDKMKDVAHVRIEDKEYKLLGGDARPGNLDGLLSFHLGYGVADCYPFEGFLGCATKEIAEHMSLYFAEDIFDAQYLGWIDYEWCS